MYIEKRRKLIIYSVFILVFLVALSAIFIFNFNRSSNLTTFKDPSMTGPELDLRESQVEETRSKLNGETDRNQRFRLYVQLGDEYRVLLGRLSEARFAYQEAEKIIPDNIVVLESLYRISLDMRDYDSANRYVERLIKIDPLNITRYQEMQKAIPQS
jgi:tetratricopeptide (TPR) repeat protein